LRSAIVAEPAFGFKAANKDFISRCPRSFRNRPLASLNAPATQRSVICPYFQRLTFLVKCAIDPLRCSMGLVVRSVRYNAPVIPSCCTVSVSSSPSQAVRRARMLGMKGRGQSHELLLGQLGVGPVPGIAHGPAHAGVNFLGQMLKHVAPLVLPAAQDERESPEAIEDGLLQRLAPSITHSRARSAYSPRSTRSLSSERTTRVLSVEPSHSPSTCLLPLPSIPKATRMTRSRKWMPSIMTTGKSSSLSEHDSHSCNCS
jgi:hypothetical protein